MIEVQRLSSGYHHVRGRGPCEWSQPPNWPCSESILRQYAFPEASNNFIREAMAVSDADVFRIRDEG